MKLLRRSAAPLKKMITVDATILHSASPLLSLLSLPRSLSLCVGLVVALRALLMEDTETGYDATGINS